MKYVTTDYDGCEYITAGKWYEVKENDYINSFTLPVRKEWVEYKFQKLHILPIPKLL